MTDRRQRPRSGAKSRSRPKSVPSFRERHGSRLRGFAILVALGDQHAANRALERALEDSGRRDAERPLEHPDGWLRRRVVHHLGGLPPPLARWLEPMDEALMVERRATLRALGASDAVIGGLSALGPLDRGLVVAHQVEHLPPAELQVMLGRGDGAAQRAVSRALNRYLRGASRLLAEEPWARREPTGQLAKSVAAATGNPSARKEAQS